MKTFLVLTLSLVSISAMADVHIGVQLGSSSFNQNYSGSAFAGFTGNSKSSFAGRGYFATDLNLPIPFVFEAGMTMGDQKSEISSASGSMVQSRSRWTFDLLGRLQLPIISIGAGAFWGFIPGMVTETTSAGTTQLRTTSEAGLGASDYGLLASARVTIPLVIVGLTIDARYLWGTHDNANIETGEARSREFQILGGVEFSL